MVAQISWKTSPESKEQKTVKTICLIVYDDFSMNHESFPRPLFRKTFLLIPVKPQR